MILYQDVYSKTEVETLGTEEYDVCCIMKAKDRLCKAVKLYDRLESLNLKCFFYLTETEESERVERKGIVYGDKMPYKQNLGYVKRSKAIAEILQGGSRGYTLRAGEAITYGKKLITDNFSVKEEPFYSPENILVYENEEDVKREFFDGKAKWEKKFAENLSPKKLLSFIDGKL